MNKLKVLLTIICIFFNVNLFAQDLKDTKQTIINKLNQRTTEFSKPEFIKNNKFKKNIIAVDDLLYLQLESHRINYIKCKRTDVDITFNYILDSNDICICVILEVESIDVIENIIMCKENEDGVIFVGHNKWIQKISNSTVFYVLTQNNNSWLYFKW